MVYFYMILGFISFWWFLWKLGGTSEYASAPPAAARQFQFGERYQTVYREALWLHRHQIFLPGMGMDMMESIDQFTQCLMELERLNMERRNNNSERRHHMMPRSLSS
jgi:hypothetical protein